MEQPKSTDLRERRREDDGPNERSQERRSVERTERADARRWPINFDGSHPERNRYVHDPLHDREVRDIYERDGALAAALHVNEAPDLDLGSRTENCGECARAVSMTLDGHPAGARILLTDIEDRFGQRSRGEDLMLMEQWAGEQFPAFERSSRRMVDEVGAWPEGANGIVCVEQFSAREQVALAGEDWDAVRRRVELDHGSDGLADLDAHCDERVWHFLNVLVSDGRPVLVDGQVSTAEIADVQALDRRFASISWIRTDRIRDDGGQR